ncbi:MAG: DMT family transporter [Thermoleophilia bacterium]
MEPRALPALGVTVVLWASAFVGIRAVLGEYSPGELALLRFLVASAALGAYAASVRMPLPRPRDLPMIFLLGLLGVTVYHLGLNYGEVTVSAGAASLMIAAVPIFTALLATAFLKERLRPVGWIGILASFCGVALVALGEGDGMSFDPRAVLVLLAAVSGAHYFVLQKPLLRTYGPLRLTTYAIWAGTLPLLVFFPGMLRSLGTASAAATISVAYLGVFPAAIAYVTWNYALSRSPASLVASFLYLPPVLTILIAWVWIGELPTVLTVVGGVVAVLGVFIVNTRGRPVT